MNWKKKDSSINTISEVIAANTGLTEEELFSESSKQKYEIYSLGPALAIIIDFLKHKKPITIVGDYDSDGITASAILYLLFKAFGVTPRVRLPKRLSEGFGLSTSIVDEIDEGLLITVDNGIVAFDAVKKAKEKGLTVIVTDHHLLDESGELPMADAIVNPHIPGTADFADYCGAGIAYKIAEKLLVKHPEYLDKLAGIAAIGTIADVMPLIHDNRRIVKKGLKALVNPKTRTSGLSALLKLCNLDEVITAENIAFKIAPILNAPGRLLDDGAMESFLVISFEGDPVKASIMADLLNKHNEDRKAISKLFTEKIELNIAENNLVGKCPMCIYEPDVPEGIVGILAGRVAEKFDTACFVFTDSSDPNVLKGSGRSAKGVDLKFILDQNEDCFTRYGGHEAAAGVSVERARFAEMDERLQKTVAREYKDLDKEVDDTIYYDLEIDTSQVVETLQELEKYEPFGEGNPKPVFLVKNFVLYPKYGSFYRVMGDQDQHIKLFGENVDGLGFDKTMEYLNENEPKTMNLVGTLSTNFFMGTITPQVDFMDFEDNSKEKMSPLAKLLEKRKNDIRKTLV